VPLTGCGLLFALVLGVGLWTLGCESSSHTASPSGLTQIKTDAELQFPVPEANLQTIRQSQNSQGLKDHAWMLFHYLVGDGPNPKWEDWCAISDQTPGNIRAGTVSLICPPSPASMSAFYSTKIPRDQALNQRKVRHLILGLSTPRQSEVLEEGKLLIADAKILEGAEVLFSPDLATKVKACSAPTQSAVEDGFTQSQIKSALLAKFPDTGRSGCQQDTASQDVLPNGSIAIKTIWVVAGTSSGYPSPAPKGKEHDNISQYIGIWHSSAGIPGSLEANDIQIDLTDQACDMPAFTSYTPPPIVPVGCFYSIPTTLEAIHAVKAREAILPGATGTSVSLILLGFHVATREMKNWTWQTFWWSGDAPDSKSNTVPTTGPYVVTDPRWGRYAMRTTLGASGPYATPPADLPQDSVANPYLEGSVGNQYGINSDCLNCHKYAVYKTKAPTLQAFNNVQTCGFNPGDQNCSALKSSTQRSSYFGVGRSTEFIWSLADSNVQGLHSNSEKNFLDKIDTFMAQINFKAEAVKAKPASLPHKP